MRVPNKLGAPGCGRRPRGARNGERRHRRRASTPALDFGRGPPPRAGGSGHLVERPVAALGRRQAAALGGDRAALHAVRVVDDHVDVARPPARPRGSRRPRPGTSSAHVSATSRGTFFCTRMWFGASSRVALPVMNTRRELVERVLAVGLRIAVLGVADEHRLLRPGGARTSGPPGILPLVAIARLTSGAARDEALLEGLARVADLVELLADRRLLDGRPRRPPATCSPALERVVDRLGRPGCPT